MPKSLKTKINNAFKQYNAAFLAFENAEKSHIQAVYSAKLEIDLCNLSGLYAVNNPEVYPEVIKA